MASTELFTAISDRFGPFGTVLAGSLGTVVAETNSPQFVAIGMVLAGMTGTDLA